MQQEVSADDYYDIVVVWAGNSIYALGVNGDGVALRMWLSVLACIRLY